MFNCSRERDRSIRRPSVQHEPFWDWLTEKPELLKWELMCSPGRDWKRNLSVRLCSVFVFVWTCWNFSVRGMPRTHCSYVYSRGTFIIICITFSFSFWACVCSVLFWTKNFFVLHHCASLRVLNMSLVSGWRLTENCSIILYEVHKAQSQPQTD